MTSTAFLLTGVNVDLPFLSRESYNLKRYVSRLVMGRPSRINWTRAISDLNLQIGLGERLAVVGSNGAGKTTLLRLLAGVLEPSTGLCKRYVKSCSILGDAGLGLDSDLTGRENLLNLLMIQGRKRKSAVRLLDEAVHITGLNEAITRPVYTYSTGMSIRLRMSATLLSGADALILDEGIGGADLEFMKNIESRLQKLFDDTPTLIIASHDLAMLRRRCVSALWLENGRINGLSGVEDVIDAYTQSAER